MKHAVLGGEHRKKHGQSLSDKYVRICPQSGGWLVDLLIKAWVNIATPLVIIGSGPQKDFLNNLIDTLNLSKSVSIKEWIDQDKLMQEYAKAKVMIISSRREGGPRVGLEALLADKGRLQAILDAEDSIKEGELVGDLSYSGTIGPVDVNAMTNLDGDKSLNLGYQTKGGTNLGFTTDLDNNAVFRLSKTFAKGGLAKILEV